MVTIFRVRSSSYVSPAKEIDACVSEYIEHVVRGLTTKEAPHLDELNASQAFSLTTIGEVEARLLGDPLELLLRQSLLVVFPRFNLLNLYHPHQMTRYLRAVARRRSKLLPWMSVSSFSG